MTSLLQGPTTLSTRPYTGFKKAKLRRLEVGDQVMILLTTESSKLLMKWRGVYIVESRVKANKMGSKTKTHQVNMLKKYIAKEPEGDVVHTSNKDDATIVIYQDTDPELGELLNLEGYHQKKGF